MSSSVPDPELKKRTYRYLALSAFLVVFNFVYGLFAHGVESAYMTFAFVLPLVFGVLPCLAFRILPQTAPAASRLWRMGLSTLIVGFLLHGVFDIYGSPSSLVPVFFWAGGILLFTGLALYVAGLFPKRQKTPHA